MLEDQDLLVLQEVRTKVNTAWASWQKYRTFSQEQIDAIVERVAATARQHAASLAYQAVRETGYGNGPDKTKKNLLAAEVLPRAMRGMKTVGVLREDPAQKIVEIGVPMGVVAAILPTTNPTSTAIYKILISLKAGNGIVLSPHPRAKACTCSTATLLAKAAEEAGAPAGLIQCLGNPTLEATNELMRHKRTAVILSTGGSGIVKAAYSSGKPAFGVGPGNVPVVVDKSADIAEAVAKVVSGKSFDYGTLCSSEQTLIFEEVLREQIFAELRKRKAFLCDAAQAQALTKVLLTAPNWAVNPACVGQSPGRIAEMAGFRVPDDTSILAAEIGGVGKEHPLSAEKLSPVLSLLAVRDFAAALDGAEAVLQFGGLGHTCAIYARDEARIRQFALRMPAMRVLCNTPTPQGSVGITTGLFPAMTLGCGAVAGNITGDNVSPLHLINTKRLAYAVRKAEDAFEAHVSDERHDGNPVPDRQAIAAAVERYMASKQVSVRTGQGGTTVAGVVDRFLAARRGDTRKSNAPPTRGAIERAFENQIEKSVEKAVPKPEAVPLTVVDFVCENDVRAAILKSQKIYIGPKTIVTPSARDLAGQYDILVLAKRT